MGPASVDGWRCKFGQHVFKRRHVGQILPCCLYGLRNKPVLGERALDKIFGSRQPCVIGRRAQCADVEKFHLIFPFIVSASYLMRSSSAFLIAVLACKAPSTVMDAMV